MKDEETLPEGTNPLPYVQVGMRVRHCLRGPVNVADLEVWSVHAIYSHEKEPVVQLKCDGRFFDKDLPASYVKKEYELAQEFNPNRYHVKNIPPEKITHQGYDLKNVERKTKALVLEDLLTRAANIALDLEWNLERFQDKNAAHFISAESDRFKEQP